MYFVDSFSHTVYILDSEPTCYATWRWQVCAFYFFTIMPVLHSKMLELLKQYYFTLYYLILTAP